ncbi:MAG: class I SAM-dependent methyltransferase [Solirubrobacteraceae bacterium]
MLEASAALILERIGPNAVVLDIGGAARPLVRADWVLDLLPYEARGQIGWDGERAQERFGPRTWIQRDICDREPWPFADRQFDFAVCSHPLEDVRDPIWVAAELQRVAAADYVEVPSLREELTYGIQGPWVGWGYHPWLAMVGEAGIELVFKHHVVNRSGSHLPAGATAGFTPAQRVQALWWEGCLDVRERFMLNAEDLNGFLEGSEGIAGAPPAGSGPRAWVRQALGRGRRSATRSAGRRIGRARWG